MIRGKRGYPGKYWSLKDVNGTGEKYIYIWDRKSYKQVERVRNGKTVLQSEFSGWKCLGHYMEPHTWEKLEEHLRNLYVEHPNMDEIERDILEQAHAMEEKRLQQLDTLNQELKALHHTHKKDQLFQPATSIGNAKRRIREIQKKAVQ